MRSMKYSDPEEDVIDDEETLNAIVAESKAKSLMMMETGLRSYLKSMGKQATYKGWIAHDYPENVTLDSRLTQEFNDWQAVWNKVTQEYKSSRRGMFRNLFNTASGIKKYSKTTHRATRGKRRGKTRGKRKTTTRDRGSGRRTRVYSRK